MRKLQTILLTGATGFLGSHLLQALLESGYKVVLLKRSTSSTWRIDPLIHRVKSYDIGDVLLQSVFEQHSIDVVIHLATLYRKYDNGQEVLDMVHANVAFPAELLELGVKAGVKAFINTGTFFEYDCSVLPVKEDALIKPFNLYARTKLAFECILQTYADQIMINTLRLFSPYGEKDNDKLIPMIIKKGLAGEKIELSEGFQKLDFIYCGDVVRAYLKALLRIENLEVENEYQVFNIGSSTPMSVREVVSIIEQNLGRNLDKVWGESSSSDIPIVFADITKAKKMLGWNPEKSLDQGIKKTLAYYSKVEFK